MSKSFEVPKLIDRFECPVCKESIIEASSVNCGHSFCAFCINHWMKKNTTCPLCRREIKQKTQCKLLDNIIDDIYDQLDDEEKMKRKKIKLERSQIEVGRDMSPFHRVHSFIFQDEGEETSSEEGETSSENGESSSEEEETFSIDLLLSSED